jgi:ribosomal protein L35
LKTIKCCYSGQKGHYLTGCTAPKKKDDENSNMVSKADFKNLCQSSLKDMLTEKGKQNKKKGNMEVYDESLDTNVFTDPWKVSTMKL